MTSGERDPLLGAPSAAEAGARAGAGSTSSTAPSEDRRHKPPPAELRRDPTTREILKVMCTLWPCLFFAALDLTIIAALAGPISASFDSFTLFSWIGSAYLITNAASQPLSGKLTDIYGRRLGWACAVTFFATGTLLCGLATSTGAMITGRLVAGVGGGCIGCIPVFIASDMVPLRQRGLWQGFGNLVFGLGMGLGGPIGGLINDHLGWKWAFLLQVPFIVVTGAWGYRMIPARVRTPADRERLRRVDFLGAACLVTSLVTLLVGLNSGGNLVPWSHPLVYVSLPLSGVALATFIYVESRVATEPIIPVRLLADRHVLAALLMNWFLTMATFELIYYLPIYFQVVGGQSSAAAGLHLLPQSVGMALGSLGSGLIMRSTGKYWYLNVSVQAIGLASILGILLAFDVHVPVMVAFGAPLGSGLAHGAMLTVTLTSMISAVDHEFQALVTSASYAFRSTGSTIGIAVASALLQNLLTSGLKARFGEREGAADEIRRISQSIDEIRRLPAGWYEGTVSAYVDALRAVWGSALAFATLCFVMALLLREHKLHTNLARK